MSILISEVHFRLSGGALNNNPNTSLGGVISNLQISDTLLNSMFDDVSTAEAVSGGTNYRLFYVHNSNSSSPFNGVNLWMNIIPSGDTVITIGLDPGGLNTTPATLANESISPAGVIFSSPSSEGTALYMGNIPSLGRYPFWVKRTQSANASPPAVTPKLSLVVKGLTLS